MNELTAAYHRELDLCRQASNPANRFNETILHGHPLWFRQREICRALVDPKVRRIAVKAGHSVGKSHVAAVLIHWWLCNYEDSGVIVTAPTLAQAAKAVWANVRLSRNRSPFLRRIGHLTKQPMSLSYDEKWLATVLTGDNPEATAGFHAVGPRLIISDEASGNNDPDIDATLTSLNASKRIDLSNPLRSWGLFYETCQRAWHPRTNPDGDKSIKVIKIPSTESPHAHLQESPIGLADKNYLESVRLDHGEDSVTWRVRVGADFPDGSLDLLIPMHWLDICGRAPQYSGGRNRLAMDLGEGVGGDPTTWLVRSDHRILDWHLDNHTLAPAAAQEARRLADEYGIAPTDITYDANGPGAYFGNELARVGLVGCNAFKGGRSSKSKNYGDFRDSAHFAMRERLNPYGLTLDGRTRPVFAIPPEFMGEFRRECRAISFENVEDRKQVLRDAIDVKAALRKSPDFSATLAMSFAYE